MLLEIDEVAILEVDWEKAKAGDDEVKERLRKQFHGMALEMHAFSASAPPYTWVTLRELEEVGILKSLTLNTQDYNG